jgi:hypothetical protein
MRMFFRSELRCLSTSRAPMPLPRGTFWNLTIFCFQLLMNVRIAITGVLSFFLLSRRLTMRQCLALFLLLIGCRCHRISSPASPRTRPLQLPRTDVLCSVASAKGSVTMPSLAMLAMVFVQATMSSLSSVYIEKLLKVEVNSCTTFPLPGVPIPSALLSLPTFASSEFRLLGPWTRSTSRTQSCQQPLRCMALRWLFRLFCQVFFLFSIYLTSQSFPQFFALADTRCQSCSIWLCSWPAAVRWQTGGSCVTSRPS